MKNIISILENIPLILAIKILKYHLKRDDGYFYSWQSNIAIDIYDEIKNMNIEIIYDDKLHKACNNGAITFLKKIYKILDSILKGGYNGHKR